jgi:hypothetical protein
VSGQLHALPHYLQERAPGTYWIEGWVGPRAGLDAVEESLLQLLGIESRPVAVQTELSQLQERRERIKKMDYQRDNVREGKKNSKMEKARGMYKDIQGVSRL